MLLIGTGGMAREVAGILEFDNPQINLTFFNNVDDGIVSVWNKYDVIKTEEEALKYFEINSNNFISCIANPILRKRLNDKFIKLGGSLENAISYRADISHFVKFEKGIVIQPTCVVASDVTLRKGVFLNANAIIGHDSLIHQYVSLGPGVRVLGNVEIGEFSYIGTNAVIMPGVKIGKKVRIGVGKIITEDVPDNSKIM